MNVSEFLLAIVDTLGADTVFSLTGGMAMHINRAVGSSGLRVIYCNHEQACVSAADGYAKAYEYQVPGIAVVTSGPGVTNTLTSLASAFQDSVPLVLIAGQVKSADINRFGVRSYGAQEVPSIELIRPLVKDAVTYCNGSISDERLAALFAAAITGRKGPVFLEVPLDVQSTQLSNAEKRLVSVAKQIELFSRKRVNIDESEKAAIHTGFTSALRPVLMIGNGNRIAGVSRDRLRLLIDRLQVPVLTTWPSADLIDATHPLHYGCPGGLAPTHSNRILQNADFILFLGARLDLLTTGFKPEGFGKRARRIVVDIDLAELEKLSRFPEILRVCADVGEVVEWLIQADCLGHDQTAWIEKCRLWREEDRFCEEKSFEDTVGLNARTVAKACANRTSGMTFAATGSGYAIEGFARFFQASRGNRLFYAGHSLGAMGMGLPSAIGAAAAKQGRVVCIEADGGILLNIQELLTLQANADLEVSIVVLNNGGYVSISKSQERAFGAQYGASAASGLGTPDFAAIARAFRFEYMRVEDKTQLEAVLDEMTAGRTRFLCDVRISDDNYRGPGIVTRFREDGTPYSSDIEEVEWITTTG